MEKNKQAPTTQQLLEANTTQLFGKDKSEQLRNYKENLKSIQTTADFAKSYQQGLALRDTLVEFLGTYIETFQPDSLPDLFWLKDAIPTHQPQLVAEGTTYYLFNDYKKWLELAQQTESTEDDVFINLNIALFPEDSIEYFYPIWFMQTWDYGGHSLLGRKEHQKILQKATTILQKMTESIFKKEIQTVKNQLLHDILSKENTYWESKKILLAELDEIIHSEYVILSENDKIDLQKRRKQFENHEKFGIQLNQQSGIQ